MISPTPALGAPEQFDTGPLSWVMAEIREALNQSVRSMTEALSQAGDSQMASLRQARMFLHQAHGALQMVDIDGITAIPRSAEEILNSMNDGSHKLVPADVEDIAAAYQALTEYLEELLAGGRNQPVRLYPYYKILLGIQGAERIHPSDLFFPNLSARAEPELRLPLPPQGEGAEFDLAGLRQRYEKALLPFLKSSDADAERANALLMSEVIGAVEAAQSETGPRRFWWVMRGFAGLVGAGQLGQTLSGDKHVKQLFARINMQLRKLAKPPYVVDEIVLRDALFFIALAEHPTALSEQIRAAYGLAAMAPADFERKRYGQVDGYALAEARRHLAEAKSCWSRIIAGDDTGVSSFEQAMQGLADAGPALKSPPLAKLLRELSSIATHAAHAGPDEGLGLGLEMASGLLFVENALNHTSRLTDDFSQRAEALNTRLLAMVAGERAPASVQWLDEMSRAAHERESMVALTAQMKGSLAQVEKVLDAYFNNPAEAAGLLTVDPALQQIEGILAVLDQGQAALVVRHTRAAVSGLATTAGRAAEAFPGQDATDVEEGLEIIAAVAAGSDTDEHADGQTPAVPSAAQQERFAHVAQNIGALSFFIETLQNNPEGAAGRFSFDKTSGIFHADLLGQLPAPPGVGTSFKAGAPAEAVAAPTQAASAAGAGSAAADGDEVGKSAVPADNIDAAPVDAPAPDNASGKVHATTGDAAQAAPAAASNAAGATNHARSTAEPAAGAGAVHDGVPVPDPSGELDLDALRDRQRSAPATAALPAVVLPQTDAAIDAELLEIFLGEAVEVLAFVRHTLPLLKQAPSSFESMTALRRSFHTLKGSGRMVGLMAFGEAAWSIERVLNLHLAESTPGSADLYRLLEMADGLLSAWVEDLQITGVSSRDAAGLIAAAGRLLEGAPFEPELGAPAAPATGDADETVAAGPQALDAGGKQDAAAPAVIVARTAAEPETEAGGEPELGARARPGADVEVVADADADAAVDSTAHADTAAAADVDAAAETQAGPDSGDTAEAGMPGGGAEHADTVPTGTVIGFPARQAPEQPRDDNIKRIGTLEISMPLYNIYLAETDELVRLLGNDLAEWRHEPDRRVNTQAVNAAHSLTGSSATVGFAALQELAHAHELLLLTLARLPDPLRPFEFDAVAGAIDCMKRMLTQFALGELAGPELRQVQALQELKARILARAVPPVHEDEEEDAAEDGVEAEETIQAFSPTSSEGGLDNEFDLDIDFDVGASFVAEPLAPAPRPEQDVEAVLDIPDISDASLKALADDVEHNETVASSESPLAFQSMGQEDELLPDLDLDLDAEIDLDAALPEDTAAGLAGLPVSGLPGGDETAAAEAAAEAAAAAGMVQEGSDLAAPDIAGTTQVADAGGTGAAANDDNLAAVSALMAAAIEVEAQAGSDLAAALAEHGPDAGVAAGLTPGGLPEHLAFPAEVLYEHERGISTIALSQPKDELDADLLPVFIEEANDILPEMARNLRQLQQSPGDRESVSALLRLLHTIKGSARMAGAMVLGQHLHEMESRIEQVTLHGAPSVASVEELLARFDTALALFERLQHPAGGAAVAALPGAEVTDAAGTTVPAPVAIPAVAAGRIAASVPETPVALPLAAGATAQLPPAALVRVRADLLDRLVNQAGEVSIARSRVESDVAIMKAALAELGENVGRLQGQLREIEIQAESQMASQMQQASDREFDPLEFDRFTRLQELTRIIAESVNDVASVQQNLSRTVDDANHNLVQQARFTRDLQQDLMRVRMVQFASISERLYRITRQASKELDKRVNLDIRGGSVEIDRSVLEKMTGPFEHLLRNSIVHGIESRAERGAAGKNDTGELLVEVRQAGNEVVIRVSDDGRGLDLSRIAEKARATGLLSADSEPSEAEVRDMIFHPGFSTAREITELAGRGIGMDVVRAEAVSLGGRITIDSVAGKGAQFTIHLPLTLAVTQVVVVSTGGKTYAVPSVLVEQVQQLKSHALASAYNEGAVMWLNQRVPLYYLSTLLGDQNTAPLTQQYSPVLILKSGTERVALHVDTVLGNREVVIKNIGPQLSRMIGVAGATVLGAGDIVLILDPVPLAQRLGSDPARGRRQHPAGEIVDDQVMPVRDPADLALAEPVDMPGAVAELAAVAEPAPAVPDHETAAADAALAAGGLDGAATGQQQASAAAAQSAAVQETAEPSDPAQKTTAAQARNQARAEAKTASKSQARTQTKATLQNASQVPAAPASVPVQGLRTQRTVMVVDDSLTVRRVTQRMLVREGYQVVLAKDGVDALEQLQAITPDVMLVDIEMPRMDGFDLTRNVRGDERTRAIPIIMITSRTAVKHRTYAMELGVNEYLGKPYQEAELLKLVAGFMLKEAQPN